MNNLLFIISIVTHVNTIISFQILVNKVYDLIVFIKQPDNIRSSFFLLFFLFIQYGKGSCNLSSELAAYNFRRSNFNVI